MIKIFFSRKFYLHVIFVYINFFLLQILYQNIMTITLSSTLRLTIVKSESLLHLVYIRKFVHARIVLSI